MNDLQVSHALFPKTESLLHPDSKPHRIALSGSQQVREQIITAVSKSSTSCNFNVNLNPSQILDRKVYLRYKVDAIITADTNNEDVEKGTNDNLVPAFMPLHRAMKSMTASLNGTSLTVEPHAINASLQKFQGREDYELENSLYPSQPDPFNRVARMTDVPASGTVAVGGGQTPFLSSRFSSQKNPRCDFPYTQVETQAKGASQPQIVTRTYEFTEPIQHPFFSNHDEGLCNVSNLGLDITWNAFNSMFLKSTIGPQNASGASTVTYTFNSTYSPELLIRTHAPSVEIPQSVTVPLDHHIVRRYTFSSTMAVRDTQTVTTSSIQLDQVPDRIYLFARQLADITTDDTPDGWVSITGLTMNTDSQQGIFTGATQQQLYQMSRKNGSEQTWKEFSEHQGSIVCIDLTQGDVGNHIAGTRAPFIHDFSVNFKNTFFNKHVSEEFASARTGVGATSYQLYVVYEMDGVLTLTGHEAIISSGTDVNKVLNAMARGPVHGGTLMGGSTILGGGFGSFARSLRKIIKKVGVPAIQMMEATGLNQKLGPKGQAVFQASKAIAGAGVSPKDLVRAY